MEPQLVTGNFSVCRICLNYCGQKSQSMLLPDGKLSKMYEFCCGIAVTINDTSKLICKNCKMSLKQFADFKRKCLKSDALWKTLVKKEEPHINFVSVKDENGEDNDVDVKSENYKNLDQEVRNKIETDVKTNIQPDVNIAEIYRRAKDDDEYSNTEVYTSSDFISEVDKNVDQEHDQNIEVVNNGTEIVTNENKTKEKTKCKYCLNLFASGRGISKHMKACKNKETVSPLALFLACGLCDFKSDFNAVKEHLQSHFESDDLACKQCFFVGADFAELVAHRYTHLVKDGKVTSYMCHICGKLRQTQSELSFHYRSVHYPNSGMVCRVSKKEFEHYTKYKKHVRNHRRNYICDHCGRNFSVRSKLIEHLQNVLGTPNYFCDKCGKSFTKSNNFKMHVLCRHTESVPLRCHHCPRIFKNQFNLDQHHRRYAADKTFQCDICSKMFARESILNKHKIWHTDDRPFRCDICGVAYRVKNQLTIHMRKHTGIFPYKCDKCEKGFASSNQLKVHLSVHTGVRKYKCEACTRSFHGKHLLRKHHEKAHNVCAEKYDK